jgi:hypothetical protein
MAYDNAPTTTNESDRQNPEKRGCLSLNISINAISAAIMAKKHQTGTSARVFKMVSDIIIPAIRGKTSLKEGQSCNLTCP